MSINNPENSIDYSAATRGRPNQPAQFTHELRAGVRTAAERASAIRDQNRTAEANRKGRRSFMRADNTVGKRG